MENLVFNKKNNSIQKLNLTLKKEKHTIIKNNKNSIGKFFICPKCNLNIPSLPFFINPIEGGSIEILINCKCGNKDRMPLEDYFNFKIPVLNINICEECNSNEPNLNCLYCIDCSKWICECCRKYFNESENHHNYSEYPILFGQTCNFHINHENLFYCNTCSKELCKKCKHYHQSNHNIINLIDYYNRVKELHSIKNIENDISMFNNKIEDLKNKCLENFEKIEMEFEISKNEFYSDSNEVFIDREKFLEIYENNLLLNKQLDKFIHTLYNIFILSQNHPTYSIIHNFEISSFINNNFPKIEEENKNNSKNSYISMYKKIYKYFKENHILSIKSLILMKEENNYLEKYDIRHLLKINDETLLVITYSNFQMFNINTKKLSPMMNGHDKEITKIIQLKNGNIVSGSQDGQIKIWTVNKLFLFNNSLSGHDDEIIELIEISKENLLSADKNGKIILWDINKLKQIQIFFINSIIFSITEISLLEFFIITEKNFIVFQNNKKLIKESFNETKVISALFVKSNLICCNNDNKMNIYQINPFQYIKTLSLNNNIITLKVFNDKYYYGISSDYNLLFFKLSNFEQITCIIIKTYNIYELLYMNEYIAYCGSNNGLIEWDINFHDLIDDYVDNIVFI